MTKTILLALAVLAAAVISGSAQADPYAWCAQYGGRSGATNCYFMTLGQCQAAVSGVGGYCHPNAFYTGRAEATERQHKPRRHHE
jgi:hypothetical protein